MLCIKVYPLFVYLSFYIRMFEGARGMFSLLSLSCGLFYCKILQQSLPENSANFSFGAVLFIFISLAVSLFILSCNAMHSANFLFSYIDTCIEEDGVPFSLFCILLMYIFIYV